MKINEETKWEELKPEQKNSYKCIVRDAVKIDQSIANDNAKILTNWNYGLNITLITATFYLHHLAYISRENFKYCIYIFLLSLLFIILSSVLEYIRFTRMVSKVRKAFKNFQYENGRIKVFENEIRECKSWVYVVIGMRSLAYLLTIFGSFSLLKAIF